VNTQIPPTPASSTQPAKPPAPPQRLALARAETGGGGNLLVKILFAAIVVAVVVGAVMYFSEKPAVAVGEITHLTAYPIHRVSNSALDAEPRAAKVENTFDQIIVIAEVRLRNQSKIPIYLSDISALLTLPNEEDRSFAANATNYNRLFLAYPELAPMKQQPLLRDATIPAGETVEGQLIFNYPITQDQWNARKSLDVTISFVHQNDITLTAPQ
jgi:hypothetical protein